MVCYKPHIYIYNWVVQIPYEPRSSLFLQLRQSRVHAEGYHQQEERSKSYHFSWEWTQPSSALEQLEENGGLKSAKLLGRRPQKSQGSSCPRPCSSPLRASLLTLLIGSEMPSCNSDRKKRKAKTLWLLIIPAISRNMSTCYLISGLMCCRWVTKWVMPRISSQQSARNCMMMTSILIQIDPSLDRNRGERFGTPLKFNSSPLKMDGYQQAFPFGTR